MGALQRIGDLPGHNDSADASNMLTEQYTVHGILARPHVFQSGYREAASFSARSSDDIARRLNYTSNYYFRHIQFTYYA
ncbi:MAG TPA: hypothetical protein ACHBX0_05760 [Arsenophonus sp.]